MGQMHRHLLLLSVILTNSETAKSAKTFAKRRRAFASLCVSFVPFAVKLNWLLWWNLSGQKIVKWLPRCQNLCIASPLMKFLIIILIIIFFISRVYNRS